MTQRIAEQTEVVTPESDRERFEQLRTACVRLGCLDLARYYARLVARIDQVIAERNAVA